MSDIIEESFIRDQPIPVSLEGTKKIIYQMENCICKIYCNNGLTGTGFFCKIKLQNNLLPFLITNNHILGKEDIESHKFIKLTIKNKIKTIEIDKARKKYTNEQLDVTFIEIRLNKDKIDEKNFMEIDENDLEKDSIESEYRRKSIYILHYPKGELNVSYGLINDLIDEKINHYCNTEEGSSGSPILSLETNKIIGVHYGSSGKKLNYGIFIKNIIDEFNKYYSNEYKKEINIIYNKKKNNGNRFR